MQVWAILCRIKNYGSIHGKSYIGHITLDRLQPTYIQKMVNELFKEGYKRATVKQSVSVVSQCLEKAVTIRMIFFNPCKGVVLHS